MPEFIPPVAWATLLGALLSFGAVSHVERSIVDRQHKTIHKDSIELDCPSDTTITIVEGAKKTCLKEYTNSYGMRKRYLRKEGTKRQ